MRSSRPHRRSSSQPTPTRSPRTRSATAVHAGHRQGTQSRGDPSGRRAAGLRRLAAGGGSLNHRLTALGSLSGLSSVSRRSGWFSGTCTKISVTPSGSVTCISCRPHGSCRASRAIARRGRSAPSRWRRRRGPAATACRTPRSACAVAGEFDQRLARVEHCARAVVAGDRQAELVAVEPQRALVVGRPEEHPAGQDLHDVVSITSGAGFGRDTVTAVRAGCSRCRFIIALSQPGAKVSRAWAVTAIRGAMRTGRVRAAVTIQSAASAALSAGSPS